MKGFKKKSLIIKKTSKEIKKSLNLKIKKVNQKIT